MLRTTIAGSLPQPSWLAEPGAVFTRWRLEGPELAEAQDDAVRLALTDQQQAGIDLVTDGEQRRRHYIWGFLAGLTGIDTEQLGVKRSRGGRYAPETRVARIVDDVTRPGPVFVDALTFARRHTDRPIKVTLPGPMTIVDSLVDHHGQRSDPELALHFAGLLNAEARALVDAGVDVVQFDEPAFNIYLDEVADWGLDALEHAVAGVTATTAVHICYGYGVPAVLRWKQANTDWGHYGVTLPLLARSTIDMVSVECAASGVDPAVLAVLAEHGKAVMAGVIDVGTEDVETAEVVAGRIRAVLAHVPPDQLLPCTDCGLVPRSRDAAVGKLHALAAGATLVRDELTQTRERSPETTAGGVSAGRPPH